MRFLPIIFSFIYAFNSFAMDADLWDSPIVAGATGTVAAGSFTTSEVQSQRIKKIITEAFITNEEFYNSDKATNLRTAHEAFVELKGKETQARIQYNKELNHLRTLEVGTDAYRDQEKLVHELRQQKQSYKTQLHEAKKIRWMRVKAAYELNSSFKVKGNIPLRTLVKKGGRFIGTASSVTFLVWLANYFEEDVHNFIETDDLDESFFLEDDLSDEAYNDVDEEEAIEIN